jgi:nucleoside-diphosphate-sugar epimerase
MVTVLGSSGFIGGRLARTLRAYCKDVYTPLRRDENVFSRPLGDVYYCIGMTANFGSDPYATFEAHNSYLIRIMKEASFDRIVYLSSTRLYDGLLMGNEDSDLQLNPKSARHLYDITKALGEHFVCMHGKGRGMVARLSCVYASEHDASGFFPELLRELKKGKSISLSSSRLAARDYVHIDDVLEGLQLIMNGGQPGKIYNVASGENTLNSDLADLIEEAGWSVEFSDIQSNPPLSPKIEIGSMRTLGWAPRTVQQFLKNYLCNE